MTVPNVELPRGRHVLGSYPSYAQAQQVVDTLSDAGFEVAGLAIVGADLRVVEQVTGRLTTGRAALAGAASGAWFGLLLGLFVGLFATRSHAFIALLIYGLVIGAIAGAIAGALRHSALGGRHDFSSSGGLVASRYEVLVDQQRADDAERVLATNRR